jgi:hypothetical protein
MLDYQSFRRSATKYWERRRLWYNLALVFPALLGYAPSDLSAAVGDQQRLGAGVAAGLWLFSAVGVNVCFTFAYALEFLFATEDPNARWIRSGRRLCFVLGTLFGMVVAFTCARNIYILEYYHS